jgi:monovalent cation:H+ antiporter-2, CPA2 family
MILGETHLSRRAAEETLPLRDAFAVLFFVAVGMLFDPAVLLEQPLPLLATVFIIVFGKSVAAFAIVRAFGHPTQTALTVSASLAQIGEFSFILAGLGTGLGVLPSEGRDLILAGAILSILANPFIFSLVAGRAQSANAEAAAQYKAEEEDKQRRREEHVILVGYGRVGRMIAAEMANRGRAIVIVEDQADVAQRAQEAGFQVVRGNATQEPTLRAAGIEQASKMLVAIPEGFEGGVVAERARALNPELPIIARAHSDAEVEFLSRLGADHVVMGERETAARMIQLSVQLANEATPGTA